MAKCRKYMLQCIRMYMYVYIYIYIYIHTYIHTGRDWQSVESACCRGSYRESKGMYVRMNVYMYTHAYIYQYTYNTHTTYLY